MKQKKVVKTVSESDLRKRLKGSMSSSEITEALKSYTAASKNSLPDMKVISELAQKKKETNALKVNFTLSADQYELLSEYFQDEGVSGTDLVKEALTQFITEIAE